MLTNSDAVCLPKFAGELTEPTTKVEVVLAKLRESDWHHDFNIPINEVIETLYLLLQDGFDTTVAVPYSIQLENRDNVQLILCYLIKRYYRRPKLLNEPPRLWDVNQLERWEAMVSRGESFSAGEFASFLSPVLSRQQTKHAGECQLMSRIQQLHPTDFFGMFLGLVLYAVHARHRFHLTEVTDTQIHSEFSRRLRAINFRSSRVTVSGNIRNDYTQDYLQLQCDWVLLSRIATQRASIHDPEGEWTPFDLLIEQVMHTLGSWSMFVVLLMLNRRCTMDSFSPDSLKTRYQQYMHCLLLHCS